MANCVEPSPAVCKLESPVEYVEKVIAAYRAAPAPFYGGALSHPDLDETFAQEVRKLLDKANLPFEMEFTKDPPRMSIQVGVATSWNEASQSIVYRPLCLSANKV